MNAATLADGRSSADMAGMVASIACAIHCAAMPLVISYLPMLGLSWLADESFHQVMAGVCFLLAVSAFLPGWRKHRSLIPAGIGSAGVALLALAAFGLEGECCPACAAAADETSASEPVCTDEQCTHCVGEQSGAIDEQSGAQAPLQVAQSVQTTQEVSRAGLGGWVLPLITPFGGLLLVAGHLVNHRKSCRCQGETCCLPSVTPLDA